MPITPIAPDDSNLVHLTQILHELASKFSTGGFEPELREPYREYGTDILGRDLKITHPDTPAYYAAIKALAQPDGTRLVAQSATFFRPGLSVRVWPQEAMRTVPYGEIFQFVKNCYDEFCRDELAARPS